MLQSLDPTKKKRDETKAKASQIMDRLGLKELELNEYEEIIATEVIFPEDIPVNFSGKISCRIYFYISIIKKNINNYLILFKIKNMKKKLI